MNPSIRSLRRFAVALLLPLAAASAAAGAEHFPGADLDNGRALHTSLRCVACHTEKTHRSEDGFIYLREERKVKSLFDLRRYVSTCNSELSLHMFPEDERDVAAFLNQTYYQLKE